MYFLSRRRVHFSLISPFYVLQYPFLAQRRVHFLHTLPFYVLFQPAASTFFTILPFYVLFQPTLSIFFLILPFYVLSQDTTLLLASPIQTNPNFSHFTPPQTPILRTHHYTNPYSPQYQLPISQHDTYQNINFLCMKHQKLGIIVSK